MFFIDDFAVSTSHKHSAEVLCRAAMFTAQKIHVSYELCPGMSYHAGGHEFSVNESTVYIK